MPSCVPLQGREASSTQAESQWRVLGRQCKMGPIGEGVLGAFKGQEGFTEVTLEQILYLPSWNTAYMLKKKISRRPSMCCPPTRTF